MRLLPYRPMRGNKGCCCCCCCWGVWASCCPCTCCAPGGTTASPYWPLDPDPDLGIEPVLDCCLKAGGRAGTCGWLEDILAASGIPGPRAAAANPAPDAPCCPAAAAPINPGLTAPTAPDPALAPASAPSLPPPPGRVAGAGGWVGAGAGAGAGALDCCWRLVPCSSRLLSSSEISSMCT